MSAVTQRLVLQFYSKYSSFAFKGLHLTTNTKMAKYVVTFGYLLYAISFTIMIYSFPRFSLKQCAKKVPDL